MTPAVASPKSRISWSNKLPRDVLPWLVMPAAFAGLLAFLVLTPAGVAEPLQSLASWLVIAAVAALAVVTVVKGLERLLDCEAD